MDGAEYVDGPCKSLDRILEQFTEPKEIVRDKSTGIFDQNSILRLVPSKLKERQVFKCPRVGINLKRSDEQRERFWLADYRFLIYPEKTKKMKDFVILSMIKEGKSS